jgi:RimJ/RimL family protein N-acetyltransferase
METLFFADYLLRPLNINDSDKLLTLVNNNRERIRSYLPKTANAVKDIETAKAFIEIKIRNQNEKTEFCFLIERISDKKFAGLFFLKNFDWTVSKCELGYFIDKDLEGKGIISGAMAAIIPWSFGNLNLNKLFIRSAEENIGSRRIALKNGFKEEGVLRKDFMTENGELIDVVYYGLINRNIK